MGAENQKLMELVQKKDEEIAQWQGIIEEAEWRINKLKSSKKDGKKMKKAMREKNKEISSMRQELLLLRNGADPDLKNQIE